MVKWLFGWVYPFCIVLFSVIHYLIAFVLGWLWDFRIRKYSESWDEWFRRSYGLEEWHCQHPFALFIGLCAWVYRKK